MNEAVRGVWNRIAPFWDEQLGEGNDFQTLLLMPALDSLLAPQAGQRILEIACGNGAYARHLAAFDANVLATDLSDTFLERAAHRTTEDRDRIEYRPLDATDATELSALGEGSFDAVVCNMALMDMVDVAPLFAAIPRLLKANGRFVFSVMHPCFNNYEGTRLVAEEIDRDGRLGVQYSVKVLNYVRPSVTRGIGMHGQPESHYYFHRPLNVLFQAGFDSGLVLDGLEEPVFSDDVPSDSSISWRNYREIPPVMIARMRPGQPSRR